MQFIIFHMFKPLILNKQCTITAVCANIHIPSDSQIRNPHCYMNTLKIALQPTFSHTTQY